MGTVVRLQCPLFLSDTRYLHSDESLPLSLSPSRSPPLLSSLYCSVLSSTQIPLLRDNAHYHLSGMPHENSSIECNAPLAFPPWRNVTWKWARYRCRSRNIGGSFVVAQTTMHVTFGVTPPVYRWKLVSAINPSACATCVVRGYRHSPLAIQPSPSTVCSILGIKTNFWIYDPSTFSNIRHICRRQWKGSAFLSLSIFLSMITFGCV